MFSRAIKWLKTFRRREEGVTAVEYGLIAGLIAVAVVGALTSNGDELTIPFTSIESALDQAVGFGSGEIGSVEPGGADDPGALPDGPDQGVTGTDIEAAGTDDSSG